MNGNSKGKKNKNKIRETVVKELAVKKKKEKKGKKDSKERKVKKRKEKEEMEIVQFARSATPFC